MTVPIPGPAWGALPPEVTSSEFWDGPGAGSMFASAEQLMAVAAQIIANLGGSEAVAAALAVNWPDPTGELSVLAAVPHLVWKGTAAGLVFEAAALITATATAFETLKAATPTPVEVGANQVEHGVLQASNFLNMLFPAIMANRTDYGRMWLTGSTNKYSYAAASDAGVGALPPVPPPPPTTTGGGGDPAAGQSGMPGKDGLGGMESMMSSVMGPLQSLGGQAGQLTSGGPLQGVMQAGQQLMGPLQQLMSAGGMNNPADALSAGAANWLTATPGAGGPVAANMVSAGGGGAGAGGLGALRGPSGWASTPTINAAAPGAAETAAVSRVNEARAALGAPTGGSGMGAAGGMMGPMMHGAGDQDKNENDKKAKPGPLAALAALYRAPDGVPVITGSGGTVFATRKGGEDQHT